MGYGAITNSISCRRTDRRAAFTLVELLTVMAIIALLIAIMLPSLAAAKQQARVSVCLSQQHNIGTALKSYALCNSGFLPGFAFSQFAKGNLPLSGHWGGQSQAADPDCFGRLPIDTANLHRLLADGHLASSQLLCPAEAPAASQGYFPYTSKYSSYCLRLPYSADLFASAGGLVNWNNRGLLGVYTTAAGGQSVRVFGTQYQIAPCANAQGVYSEADPVSGAQQQLDFAAAPILADQFWYQDFSQPAGQKSGVTCYAVAARWLHGSRFNVLMGDSSARTIADDGTVKANTQAPGSPALDDGFNNASYALRVWRFFEAAK